MQIVSSTCIPNVLAVEENVKPQLCPLYTKFEYN